MQKELEVNIDFDGASHAWNSNKRRIGQMYMYVCGYITKTGNACKRIPIGKCDRCYQHKNGPTSSQNIVSAKI
jgi:hypothetical protein